MKITQVSYLKTFPLGQFINEKIEITIDLNEGDDVQSALSLARSECELNHKTNNPHLYQEQETMGEYPISTSKENPLETDKYQEFRDTPISQHLENQRLTQEQKFLQLISLATSTKELSMYEKTANNPKYPNLKEAYDKKLKQLTNEQL